MGARELRAAMRGPMRALGFQAGRLSFHLPLAGGLRLTVSQRTTAMGDGGRAAIIGLALYRLDAWQEHCLDHGHDVEREHDAGCRYGRFQARDDLGHVLDRPHQHQWPLRSPQESRESAISVVRCVDRFLRPRVVLVEERADTLIRSGSLVSSEQIATTWLRDDEPCPYGPCAEPGRPAASGGVDEPWWRT